MEPDFVIKQGDLLPTIRGFIEDKNGAVALPVGTTIKFLMRKVNDNTAKVNQPATILNGTTGEVEYAWQGTDTDTAEIYEAEWEVTFTSGKKLSSPSRGYIIVQVKDDIG